MNAIRSLAMRSPGLSRRWQRLLELLMSDPRLPTLRYPISSGRPLAVSVPPDGCAWLSCASCRNMSRASRRLLTGHLRSRDSRKTQYHGHPLGALVYESGRAHPGHGTLDQQPWARRASSQQH